MSDIGKFLNYMLQHKASDLHISAGDKARIRKYGELEEVQGCPILSNEIVERVLFSILKDEQKEIFNQKKELDFGFEFSDSARFRVNYFHQKRGLGAVFRCIPKDIPSFEDLKLPKSLLKFCNMNRGLVLVTGPTGSGKSTTLAALIDYINTTRKDHILTIEDPIEFVHISKGCLVNQREVGKHTNSFASALRSALREDPDVILVGEMRDLETIELAITAAETGHVVFGTLHTSSAAKTVDRIIDAFPSNQQAQIRVMLSESLKGVISQQLLKRADKSGRIAALEILFVNTAVANLIREGKTFQIPSIIQTGKADGMQLMDQVINEYLMQKIITPEEAFLKSNDKKAFERFLKSGTVC
ncbi:MAG: type IV pilus twitching motility protein PilT [Thermodesulfovibrionales bacterium]|nr:type IV pilus twitching motility protein PilT [Thermodesulfovibrionales bacterium]